MINNNSILNMICSWQPILEEMFNNHDTNYEETIKVITEQIQTSYNNRLISKEEAHNLCTKMRLNIDYNTREE